MSDLDDAYDQLWEATTLLDKAKLNWKAGAFITAHNEIVEAINLLTDVEEVTKEEAEHS